MWTYWARIEDASAHGTAFENSHRVWVVSRDQPGEPAGAHLSDGCGSAAVSGAGGDVAGTVRSGGACGRHRLSEVVRAIGNLTYGAGVQAVRRFEVGISEDRAKARFVEALKRRLREKE